MSSSLDPPSQKAESILLEILVDGSEVLKKLYGSYVYMSWENDVQVSLFMKSLLDVQRLLQLDLLEPIYQNEIDNRRRKGVTDLPTHLFWVGIDEYNTSRINMYQPSP